MHLSLEKLIDAARAATANLAPERRIVDVSGVAQAMDLSPQTVSNWKVRGVSQDGALQAEALFGVPATWLLSPAREAREPGPHRRPFAMLSTAAAQAFDWHSAQAALISAEDPRPRQISWEELMANNLPKRFRLSLRDHALAPDLLPGDELEMERDIEPLAGDLVLLRDQTGSHVIRQLTERLPGRYVAVALNPAFAPLDLVGEGLVVVAVSVAETRQRRRSG